MAAYSGMIVDVGMQEALNALSNGWTIDVTGFSVTKQTPQPLHPLRDNFLLEEYRAPVSGYSVLDKNNIIVTCEIPEYPDGGPIPAGFRSGFEPPFIITELYLFITNKDSEEKLFFIGQPPDVIVYRNNGTITLDIVLTLNQIEEILTFNSTQALQIEAHNDDPNAHPQLEAKLTRDSEWLLNHYESTAYASANSFTVGADVRDRFVERRRIRAQLGVGSGATYVYSQVNSASYNAGTNTTTVVLADSVLNNTLSRIYFGILTTEPNERSIPVSDSVSLNDSRTLASSKAVRDHASAANPHSGSASTTDLSNHVGAANPHSGSASTTDLSNHVSAANPHSDSAAASTTMTAGNGLTGGGTLAANRTFTLGTPSTLTGSTTNSVTAESHTHNLDMASEAEAQAGTNNTKLMTPLRTAQAIGSLTNRVYTDGFRDETNFPIGHFIFLDSTISVDRNGVVLPTYVASSSWQYSDTGLGGVPLLGTWHSRGRTREGTSGNRAIVAQRVL